MKRRHLLAAATAGLAMPAVLRAQGVAGAPRTLRFIPQSDLTVLDPHWTTAYVTRNHGFMVFDTLYGTNGAYEPSPQMVAGHTVENDGKLWRLTLRPGLLFHDGTPVLARDCVASMRRWARQDAFGQALMAATDELSADGDRAIVFRLKQPVPAAAGGAGQDHHLHARHDAGAPGDDRRVDAGAGDGGQRPVPLRGRRARARLAGASTASSTGTSRCRPACRIGPPGPRSCISTGWSGT